MPLIFAVDNDKRQSAQLASLLRAHVDADLVQCATVVDGIGVLQGRIPDLVLTSSLLSPKDEAALANHMRELGARAAHVQTLTIPVLATTRRASKKRSAGMLGALRREKGGDVDPAGCQPEVFAKEVRIYLERAIEERTGAEAEPETQAGDSTSEPVYAEPVYTEPVYTEPVDAEPAYAEPAYAETAYEEPVYAEPVAEEPVHAEPVYVEPVAIVEALVEAQAPEPPAVVEREPPVPDDPAPGDLYLDRPEVIARDTLMAQAPAVVAEAFAPPEPRVPVVDMNTFDDLDALAAQLAAPSEAAPAMRAPARDPFEDFFVPQPAAIVEAAPEERLEAAVEPEPVVIPAVTSDTWFDRMTAAVTDEPLVKPEVPQAPEPVFSWIDNQNVSSLSDVLSRVRASDSDAQAPVQAPPAVPAVSQPPASVVPMAAAEPAPIQPVVPDPVAAVPDPTTTSIAAVARPEVVVELVLPPAAPFLDPEVLAMFGVAAHRAGLDALESLARPRTVERDQAVPALPIPGPERPPRVARESKAERRSRRKAPRPAQDEWGMYDPNQCGPAALFDEDAWNEVEAEEKTPARRPRAS